MQHSLTMAKMQSLRGPYNDFCHVILLYIKVSKMFLQAQCFRIHDACPPFIEIKNMTIRLIITNTPSPLLFVPF